MKKILTAALISAAFAVMLFTANLYAQTDDPPAQPSSASTVAPDHDGDGIPNGQDPDFVKGAGQGRGTKLNFIDENGDGICDYFQNGQRSQGRRFGQMNRANAKSQNFVDADGDGICDYNQSGSAVRNGNGRGPNFVDANGDGICDNFQNGAIQQRQGVRKGRGMGRGK